ncbi:hypothetical protein D3C81_1919070 [compost metagenome]
MIVATCNRLAVLHSCPVLQGLPCSAGLPMSSQQSGVISMVSAMVACIGQGSTGACTPAIPAKGSAKLIRKIR